MTVSIMVDLNTKIKDDSVRKWLLWVETMELLNGSSFFSPPFQKPIYSDLKTYLRRKQCDCILHHIYSAALLMRGT